VPSFAPEFQLPTRLIDIQTDTLRLVLSVDLEDPNNCRYVALSHCWGDPRKTQVPKTFGATLERHQKEGITELTKTFEDAVKVTREIDVRYLWIDSLCIIQDEPEDFKKECSRMSLIYARAYCVLSALDAEDGSRGLFIPRNPSPFMRTRRWRRLMRIAEGRTSMWGRRLESIFRRSRPQPSQISLDHEQWNSMLQGPLSTRGWAFQEHQLALRIIHFTAIRILWECRCCVAGEDFPSQRHRAFVGGTADDPFYLHSDIHTTWRLFDGKHERHAKIIEGVRYGSRRTTRRRNDVYTRWLRAAELYPSRNLTYEIDKLPAVSGLAAAVAAVVPKDVYLAGIWKNDLIRGLLWIPALSGTGVNLDRISSIPSWSWASHYGSVKFLALADATQFFPPFLVRRDASILFDELDNSLEDGDSAEINSETTTSAEYPFGEVKGGSLQITAPMKECDIGPDHGGLKFRNLDTGLAEFDVILDDPSARVLSGVICAILVQDNYVFGLVLKKSNSGAFQRLGVFILPQRRGGWGFIMNTVTVE
jgi:hypothetical protein